MSAHTVVALGLLRGALSSGTIPGVPLGEAWGRLFVTSQVARWVRGDAAIGRADLLAWPDGMSFWPTDPLTQLVSVPLTAALGDTAALTAITAILIATAGLGPAVLARVLGARASAAICAGILVQISPFVLRQGTDMVLEALAIGPSCLAGAATLVALRATSWSAFRLWLVGLGVFCCATTSPYYAVYLAVICALWAVLDRTLWPQWRRWLAVAAIGAVACVLALAPLMLTESGAHGRLGPGFAGSGFHVAPTRLERPSGQPAPRARPPMAGVHERGPIPSGPRSASSMPSPTAQRVHRAISSVPGGAALLFACLLGLLSRSTRAPAAFALLVLLLSPSPWLLGSRLWPQLTRWQGPLSSLLSQLPLTHSLGNGDRLVAAYVVLAATVAGRLSSRWPALVPVLLLGAGFEAHLRYNTLALPVTPVTVPSQVIAAADGATVFFPSGDPPYWHPDVRPKEVLFLAGRAGVAVAYDFGRLRRPADQDVALTLAGIADSPIGVAALRSARPLPDDAEAWAAQPFKTIIVLGDRLAPGEQRALTGWLSAHATLRRSEGGWSAWSWPDRF